jgi:hypothetical protein
MPDPVLRDAVLMACSARDDPRFLARIVFGIVSPRVMPMRLGRDPAFGLMNVCDFMELVQIYMMRSRPFGDAHILGESRQTHGRACFFA